MVAMVARGRLFFFFVSACIFQYSITIFKKLRGNDSLCILDCFPIFHRNIVVEILINDQFHYYLSYIYYFTFIIYYIYTILLGFLNLDAILNF